jgi:hypothetical protein
MECSNRRAWFLDLNIVSSWRFLLLISQWLQHTHEWQALKRCINYKEKNIMQPLGGGHRKNSCLSPDTTLFVFYLSAVFAFTCEF